MQAPGTQKTNRRSWEVVGFADPGGGPRGGRPSPAPPGDQVNTVKISRPLTTCIKVLVRNSAVYKRQNDCRDTMESFTACRCAPPRQTCGKATQAATCAQDRPAQTGVNEIVPRRSRRGQPKRLVAIAADALDNSI
jgi:hypothetical protein